MMRHRAARNQIGLEVTVSAVRAVAVRQGKVAAAVSVPIIHQEVSRSDAVLRAFAALERKGITSLESCVAVAPMGGMTNTVLELPPRSSGAPIEALAAAELTRGAGATGLEIAVFPVRTPESGPTEYFVTAVQRDTILSLVEDVAAVGTELIAIDAPVTAFARACSSANCLIVVLEQQAIAFHAVHDGLPILSRSSPITPRALSGDAVIAEIDRCARYLSTYRADTAIEEIVVAGPAPQLQDVARDIGREFDVRVRQWGLPEGSARAAGGVEYAGAFGAATWGMSGKDAA
ncbi:MAG: hypothetical protein AAF937_02220 [Planctomycetota bacterium]